MDALEELKLQQELRGKGKPPIYRFRTQAEQNRAWGAITKPMLGLIAALANTEDSLQAIVEIQKTIPPEAGELAKMRPADLLELCRGLRIIWDAIHRDKFGKDEVKLLHTWFEWHPLTSAHWNIYFDTGTFFPTQMNWRPLIARICFDNRTRLARCLTPACDGRYFVKPRSRSKYCLATNVCRKYDNSQRQDKFQAKKKTARKSMERKA